MRVLEEGVLHREVDIKLGKEVWLIHIIRQEIMTPNKDTYMKLKDFYLISLDLNEIPMHMMT